MKPLVTVLLVFAALTLSTITGCQTQVDPTGVYATKFGPMASWMYTQDNLVDSAVKTVDAAETWELQNHAFLVTNSPATVVTLAAVRVQTKQAALTYYQERQNLIAVLASTNGVQMTLAASNAIVTTVNSINTYAGKASTIQSTK